MLRYLLVLLTLLSLGCTTTTKHSKKPIARPKISVQSFDDDYSLISKDDLLKLLLYIELLEANQY